MPLSAPDEERRERDQERDTGRRSATGAPSGRTSPDRRRSRAPARTSARPCAISAMTVTTSSAAASAASDSSANAAPPPAPSPSCALVNSGTKAEEKAPSANRRRNRLGSRCATKIGLGHRPGAERGGDEHVADEAEHAAGRRAAADRGEVLQERHGWPFRRWPRTLQATRRRTRRLHPFGPHPPSLGACYTASCAAPAAVRCAHRCRRRPRAGAGGSPPRGWRWRSCGR